MASWIVVFSDLYFSFIFGASSSLALLLTVVKNLVPESYLLTSRFSDALEIKGKAVGSVISPLLDVILPSW